ncbi:MAG: aldehyde dehydrogenase family protein [Bacteriovoracaceae bacterium]|nr:aldehyde dehydrogenase family protein [Bacteriovoracaceae bacterium]
MWKPQAHTPLRWSGDKRLTIPTLSPNDGQLLGTVEQITSQDVKFITTEILKGQKIQSTTAPHQRSMWLTSISKKIIENKEMLSLLIATEGGKPIKDARVEVERAALTFSLCAEAARSLTSPPTAIHQAASGDGKISFTLREPIGPVLALSAFNHPLNLLAHQVGSALAAGCSVVFKPSPTTPYCGEWLADTLQEIGVPLNVAMICHAEVPQIEELIANPTFAYVSFIGAAKIGWSLRSKLAPGTRLALEHGGQAPAIVWDDADIDRAVNCLIKGSFYHAGQVCISTQKIFVHQKIWEKFTTAFVLKAKNLKVMDARKDESDIGPLIRESEKKRILSWIEEAKKSGAKVLLEDSKDLGANFLGATILSHVSHENKIWKEEVFGPVVCLESFENLDSIYEDLSNNPYHFEAAVFTQNLNHSLEAIKKLPAMTVVVNDHTAWRVDAMPFGGHKLSGLGMGGVQWAIEEQTRLKQVILHGF